MSGLQAIYKTRVRDHITLRPRPRPPAQGQDGEHKKIGLRPSSLLPCFLSVTLDQC